MTHEPVLLEEILSILKEASKGKDDLTIVDGTLGLGGYSQAILEAFQRGKVLGIDRDPDALRLAEQRLGSFVPRFRAVQGNFGALKEILGDEALIDAFVFDLGVSNLQLSEAERGFSFQRDGPLDMRMDPQGDAPTAAEVLATSSAKELERIFWEHGEERYARRIASRIVSLRQRGGRLETTGELVALIRDVLPQPVQRKMGGHPARRVFQALRIFINDELSALGSMLSWVPALAARGCVIAIVSYHSLEDRIVKHRFRAWEREEGRGHVLTRRPIVPGEAEVERNQKSRSAKLRAFRFVIEQPMRS